MSALVKAKLKAARESITKKEYAKTKDNARQVLDYEPKNYNAIVFLGLACLELNEHEESERSYREAISLNPQQPLAWQGLLKFYERTNDHEQCSSTLISLLDIFYQSKDATKCAEIIQKYVELRRSHGDLLQIIEALSLYLPTSRYYDLISTLPPPDPTNPNATTTLNAQSAVYQSLPVLEEIVALSERAEASALVKEVDKRRMRLNAAGPEQLKREVGKEIWGKSQLPALYVEILNHPDTSDELRRKTEAKLLRMKQQYLHSLSGSASDKHTVASEVYQMASDAVLLRVPDELAWMIFIENKDVGNIEGYDYSMLQQFMELFPQLPLSSFLSGYFQYIGLQGEEESTKAKDTVDPLDVMMDSYTSLSSSIFVTRVVADLYLRDEDYQNTIRTAEIGLELLRKHQIDNDTNLPLVEVAFKVILATALVHFFPPKHHQRALGIIMEVLQVQPDNVPCLMGHAYVLQASMKWQEAADVFSRVATMFPDDLKDGLRSKEEAIWCKSQESRPEDGIDELQNVLQILGSHENTELDQARCLWRLGKLHWDAAGDKRDKAYNYFITCLKRDSGYPPAYTSLGIYYLEHSSPPDPIRASKCFQKAFELDAKEAEAARRLAEQFAEDREWDLVQIIAKRTIDGEGGLGAGLDKEQAISARYLPTNVWAWKALGVVELINKNYPAAIEAIRVALRADVNDYISWLCLGEAYGHAGRQAAAVKALARARELNSEDWLCSYFMGNIQRQLGQYSESIATFKSILCNRPIEAGVLTVLAHTYLDLARSQLQDNFVCRAEQSFMDCIDVSLEIIKEHPGFRAIAWKCIGDSLLLLSRRNSFFDANRIKLMLTEVTPLLSSNQSDRVSGVENHSRPDFPVDGLQLLHLAIIAYDYRLSIVCNDTATSGSAWCDLGVVLHSWYSAAAKLQDMKDVTEQCLRCIKNAIRADSGNDYLWNALGCVQFSAHPKAAQHAFILALEIDNKNVTTWTNLGLLYLHHGDVELAGEMFYRAQSLDPDYTALWVGQALVAEANGRRKEADALFEHATTLAMTSPVADLKYACHTFEKLTHQAAVFDPLFNVFINLGRYCARKPDDASALHLQGLIAERLGHFELGSELIGKAILILEASYELTEDVQVERRFAIANCNQARLQLSLNNYSQALALFESVLGLLAEPEGHDEQAQSLIAQSQLGSALAQLELGDIELAVKSLEAALLSCHTTGASALNTQVTVLLSKTLWATNTDESRENAKNLLLERIASDPEDLEAINALAGMGILTTDEALVDAALAEMLSLPLERRNDLDPQHDVDHLLKQHHLAQGDAPGALALLQHVVFTSPARSQSRVELARLLVLMNNHTKALAVLAGCAEDDDGGLRALCSEGDEAVVRAQRGVMLRPWRLENWRTLAYILSKGSG